MTAKPKPLPDQSRATARLTQWSAICAATLLVLTACGGGGGSDAPPAQPAPNQALVWGSGTWGTKQWSATAVPARIESEAATSNSLTTTDLHILETSR